MNATNDAKRLAELSRVVSFALSRDGDDLALVLRLREERTSSDVGYEFLNVSDVQFRGERTELKELVLMVSQAVSAHGWEGVRFRVKDYEEEFLSFLCGDIRRLT